MFNSHAEGAAGGLAAPPGPAKGVMVRPAPAWTPPRSVVGAVSEPLSVQAVHAHRPHVACAQLLSAATLTAARWDTCGGVPAGDCMDMAREQTSPVFHSAPLRCAGSRPQARLLRRAMGQSGASCCCTACPASRSRPWSGPRSVRAWPARSYCTAWLRCPGARSQSDLCACSHLQRPRHLHLS